MRISAERLVVVHNEDRGRGADRRQDPATRPSETLCQRPVARRTEDGDTLAFEWTVRSGLWRRASLGPGRGQPACQVDAGVVDRPDNDHARGACVAQSVVVLVADAKEARQHIEAMAWEFRPRTLGNADTVELGRLDRGAIVNQAGGGQCAFVEIGMSDGDSP